MDIILTLLAALGALAVGAALGVAVHAALTRTGHDDAPPAGGWLEDRVRHRLLVQTRDHETVEGVVLRVDADGIELGAVRWEDRDLGGTVWVPTDRIKWIQQPDQPHA